MTSTAVPSTTGTATTSTARAVIAGRVLTGLITAFLVFDSLGKLLRLDPSVEGTLDVGYADHHVVLIGALLAIGIVLHLVPRTALIGAVWLTAYLGGAVAAHVRLDGAGSAVFSALFAVVLWVGFALRDRRVRDLALGR